MYMQGTTAEKEQVTETGAAAQASPEARETAARLGAFLRYLFVVAGGEHLRAIEESGLGLTQCKTLLMLAGPEEGKPPCAGKDIAERLQISLASVSRAVDGLARKRLVTRVEDADDRRVRRVAITDKGRRLAGQLLATRMADMEAFASSLTPAQRRKLDAAIESLLDREEMAVAMDQLKEMKAR